MIAKRRRPPRGRTVVAASAERRTFDARTSNDQSRWPRRCRGKSGCFEVECFGSVAYARYSSSARAFHRFKICRASGKPPLFFRYLRVFHFEGGVPETRTEMAEKPMPSASDPSTRIGLFWTGEGWRRKWDESPERQAGVHYMRPTRVGRFGAFTPPRPTSTRAGAPTSPSPWRPACRSCGSPR